MVYFSKGTLAILEELANNNNRDWFDGNKERFGSLAVHPFKLFITDLIQETKTLLPNTSNTEESIYRIHRDVRFSKNKLPFKDFLSAMINDGGRKNKTSPGLYLELSSKEFRLLSGCFALDAKQLQKIRSHILKNVREFGNLVEAPGFKESFGNVQGEKSKRIPPEYSDASNKQPLLYNKSFWYCQKFDSNIVLGPDLIPFIVAEYEKCHGLNVFFANALKGS